MPKSHPLFSRFPLNKTVQLSTGETQTPYHVYNGYGLFVGGIAPVDKVNSIMTDESPVPVTDIHGNALLALWLMDFTEAHIAPHTEFQCSIFVQPQSVPPLPDHPFAPLQFMVQAEEPAMLCADIWNNTEECVAYNAEHLGLGARLCRSSFTRTSDRIDVDFNVGDTPLLTAKIRLPARTGFSDGLSLLRLFGLRKTIQLAQAPYTQLDVINRVDDQQSKNIPARSYTDVSTNIVKRFDPSTDELILGNIAFREIGFQPRMVQFVDGVNFVYLDPDPSRAFTQ